MMHLYVMRGLPWDPRALISDDALKDLRQKPLAIQEDAIAGGDSDADSDIPVPPVEAVDALMPQEPGPPSSYGRTTFVSCSCRNPSSSTRADP